jgi:midasin (ATPase involved in ribosome maturation)
MVHVYCEIDLLQRRQTDGDGNTMWQTTTLVHAAVTGGLALLDGLDRLPPSTLAVLRPLIEDRELTLFDGTRLMRWDRYQKLRETHSEVQMKELKIMPVMPSFRIIALALPPPAKG